MLKSLVIMAAMFFTFQCAAQIDVTQFLKRNDSTNYNLMLNRPFEVRIYSGRELVAYRKIDSAWIFINPDKTIIILDSLYKRQKQ